MAISSFFQRSLKYIVMFALLCAIGSAWASSNKVASKPPIVFNIQGITDDMLTNVETQLSLSSEALGLNPTQLSIENFYHTTPKQIQKAMAPYGYYQPHISSNLTRNQNGIWNFTFTIDKGAPVILTDVSVTITGPGSTDPGFENIVKNFPLKPGDILNTNFYTTGKQSIQNYATQHGYFNALMAQNKININLLTNEANIQIEFETGDRFRFGETTFNSRYFSERFLRRYLNYETGEYYDANLVSSLQDHLTSSGYFSNVSIEPGLNAETLGNNKPVPMSIRLSPSPARQYQLGAGYGTDTGIRGLAGLRVAHITPTGHQLNTFAHASQVDRYIVSRYLIPGHNPVTDQYQLSIGAGQQNSSLPSVGNSTNFKASVGYSTYFGPVKQETNLAYLYENYDAPALFNGNIIARMVIPSVHWSIRKVDDNLNPDNGYSADLKVSGASDLVLSNASFFQGDLSGKYLKTFFSDNRLLLRGEIAGTAINNIENLPLSLQLFAGGSQSVRGYGYQTIGPGRYLEVGSVELQRRIYGSWYVTGFFDIGSVTDVMPPHFFKGFGPGILWLSPIGAFEFTEARTLGSDNHFLFQFNMGPVL